MEFSKQATQFKSKILASPACPAFPLPEELQRTEQVPDRSVEFRNNSDDFRHGQVAVEEEGKVETTRPPNGDERHLVSPSRMTVCENGEMVKMAQYQCGQSAGGFKRNFEQQVLI